MDRPTVEIYEQSAREWEVRRAPGRGLDEARALGARAIEGPVADLGCGTGWCAAVLPDPVVAVDAARSMLERVGEHAASALRVQAELSALPLRTGALGGAWARNSFVHLARAEVPMALADLHRALAVHAPIEATFFGGEGEGRHLFADDDFPGRFFSLWSRARLEEVVAGAGFDLDQLIERTSASGDERSLTVRARRGHTLPDTVGPGMRLLVCGLNPSVYAADAGVGYARPGNRFWPAAVAAGLVTRPRDAAHALREHGIGMTDLVKRASVGAAELSVAEYRVGLARVERLVTWLQPLSVCFVGLAGWRAVVDRKAVAGVQDRTLGGVPVYVMPSTSGLNAHSRLDQLADHLRAAAALADARR